MSALPSVQGRVLVVDDEAGARAALVDLLRDEGYEVRGAGDGFKALGQLDDWSADVVITDVCMPAMDGIELMGRIRERGTDTSVIVMTAHGSMPHAVSAMREGADDYLGKPLQLDDLLLALRRTLAHRELRRENAGLRLALDGERVATDVDWIGRSASSRELLGLVRQVADSEAPVLVTGPAGTGKQLVARALHALSRRGNEPFVAVQCAGASESALARELFGTGLSAGGLGGAVRRARASTLYIDEVTELTPALQLGLLQMMQSDESPQRAGDTCEWHDVRVVAATRYDLGEYVRRGRFREDLYYRLDIVNLRTPTLAQRREDIPALAMAFLRRQLARNGKHIRGFSDRALRVLLAADWPGNVRELESCVQHAAVMCSTSEIEPRDLPREIMQQARNDHGAPPIPGTTLAQLERYAILKTLEQVRGSTQKAAELLGISPRKIQYRLAVYRGESYRELDDGAEDELPPGANTDSSVATSASTSTGLVR